VKWPVSSRASDVSSFRPVRIERNGYREKIDDGQLLDALREL